MGIRNRSYFVDALKTAGQMLINRADEFIGNVDKCFTINIVIDIAPMESPTMEINRGLYVIPDQSGSGEEK